MTSFLNPLFIYSRTSSISRCISCPASCPIVLLPALGPSIVLASSNQRLVIRRRLIFMRAGIGERLLELRSRLFRQHIRKGQFLRATFPFHTEVLTWQQHSFFRFVVGCVNDRIFSKTRVRYKVRLAYKNRCPHLKKSWALSRTRFPPKCRKTNYYEASALPLS